MTSKNWRVVRDVDVFKILVQLAPNVLFSRTVIKNKTNKNSKIHIQQMPVMIEI